MLRLSLNKYNKGLWREQSQHLNRNRQRNKALAVNGCDELESRWPGVVSQIETEDRAQ
jgi:hypothetical protein